MRLDLSLTDEQRLRLLARDSDPFNRWQAAQDVAMRLILDPDPARAEAFAEALGTFLDGEALADPAFAALVLALPTEGEAADSLPSDVNPDAIHQARRDLRARLGRALRPRLERIDAALSSDNKAYSPDAASAGRRALRNAALDLIAAGDPEAGAALATQRLDTATNMTDRLAALATIAQIPGEAGRPP